VIVDKLDYKVRDPFGFIFYLLCDLFKAF